MTTPRFLYLHGFASSPKSRKALALAEMFHGLGLELEVPDLNVPSFGKLSHQAMLDVVTERVGTTGSPVSIIGSSLGGWVASRFTELHPERVRALMLLCPGFHLAERWPKLVGEEWFAIWERHGELPLADATGTKIPVHWAFIEEARREPPAPIVKRPTLIVHGTRDETVPIKSSREYVKTCPDAKLVEVDDTHDLAASIERISAEIHRHFELGRTTLSEGA